MKRPLVIGSRGSKLALVQAEWVKAKLEQRFPDTKIMIQVVKTEGDINQESPLDGSGRKGFYTAAIEEELRKGRIDCAVHSLKDVPAELQAGFSLAAVTRREDPRDVMVSHRYAALEHLPQGARVGTASLRRSTQLKHFRADLTIIPLRGNVDTRLRKLQEENLDAIILAAAGLKRLGRENEITAYVEPTEILPSAGQGALGIEVKKGDLVTHFLKFLNDTDSAAATSAERAFIRRLSGGCQVPITAYATKENKQLNVYGLVASLDGKTIIRGHRKGGLGDAEALGLKLAEDLIKRGAEKLIKEILKEL
jgi:hydroxymethylbilane synthase